MNVLILALLGAFLWRLRGGLLNDLTGRENFPVLGIPFNDTVVRIIWSLGMGGAFWLLHPTHAWLGEYLTVKLWAGHGIYGFAIWWVEHSLLCLALFAGTTIGWFGADLIPPETDWLDRPLLSLDGLARMAPVALVLLSPWPLLAGLLFGPAYWLGARLPQKPGGWDFWGEWITGAVIGACLGAM